MPNQTVERMLNEIREIPDAARRVMNQDQEFDLPVQVPYLGMGSSWFAPLALFLAGSPIKPFPASEFYVRYRNESFENGVLISQSGKSSEVLWCRDLFHHYTAIANDPESPLAAGKNAEKVLLLHAGNEEFSSSKTYVNTLLVLLKGLGYAPCKAVTFLEASMPDLEEQGKQLAEAVYEIISAKTLRGICILGSGSSVATALQASLICSECTRIVFTGMSLAWYDHGFKETAKDSMVFIIPPGGAEKKRAERIAGLIQQAGGHVFFAPQIRLGSVYNLVAEIVPFNFMAAYLSEKLKIENFFSIGSKVTEVPED